MSSLESEIGLRLLDRSYSGVRLSEQGKALMPKIHRRKQAVDEMLENVGLFDVRERYANKLSGGMKRRLELHKR